MATLAAYDEDQGEEFVDKVFSSLLPDAYDLLLLLTGAAEGKAVAMEALQQSRSAT